MAERRVALVAVGAATLSRMEFGPNQIQTLIRPSGNRGRRPGRSFSVSCSCREPACRCCRCNEAFARPLKLRWEKRDKRTESYTHARNQRISCQASNRAMYAYMSCFKRIHAMLKCNGYFCRITCAQHCTIFSGISCTRVIIANHWNFKQFNILYPWIISLDGRFVMYRYQYWCFILTYSKIAILFSRVFTKGTLRSKRVYLLNDCWFLYALVDWLINWILER